MGIEHALQQWTDIVVPQPFDVDAWYDAAVTLITKQPPEAKDVPVALAYIAERFNLRNVPFKHYGLFVSALVNSVIQNYIPLIIPVRKIGEQIAADEREQFAIENFLENFGSDMTLDYLGYRHTAGTAIYDGDVGDQFGAYSVETTPCTLEDACFTTNRLIVNGNVGKQAGYRQKGGLIACLKDAGDNLSEEQSGGVFLLSGDGGNYCGVRKKGGETFVLGTIKDFAGKDMEGGRLQVLRNVGNFYGHGLKGDAVIEIGGNAGDYLHESQGGKIHLGSTIISHSLSELNDCVHQVKQTHLKPEEQQEN